MSPAIRMWLAILFLFLGGMLCLAAYRFTQTADWGAETEPDPTATIDVASIGKGTFDLTDQNGEPFSSEQLKGKVWLGHFFFTNCEMECPAQSRKLQLFHTDFKDDDLHIVSITCDTNNDTPSQLLKYAKQYNADATSWHFLTCSDFDYIKTIANEFFLAPLMQLTHADKVYLFGKDGTMLEQYGKIDDVTFRKMQADLQEALAAEEGAELSESPTDNADQADDESATNESEATEPVSTPAS